MTPTPDTGAQARALLERARARARERIARGEPYTPTPLQVTTPARPSTTVPRALRHDAWPARLPRTDGRRRLLLGVTTFNRSPYLDDLLTSFARTRTTTDEWWVVIADDGSTDDSRALARAWAARLQPEVSVVVVQNHAAGIAGQTNSILQCVLAIDPALAFVANDDLRFLREGWADAWADAVAVSGYEHLVLFDDAWRDPVHRHRRPGLRSLSDARGCMGAFYTVTPDLVRTIGFFDEENFPVRGHSHIDWTVRACRHGANDEDTLWELEDATDWVRLRGRDGYLETFDWQSQRARELFTPEERQRRMAVIEDRDRQFVPLPHRPRRSRVEVTATDERAHRVLALQPRLAPTAPATPGFDATVVLNLREHVQRWDLTAAQLAGAGLDPVRAEAVYGFAPEHAERWQAYADRGLELPLEEQIGRRLIQNPGALGYLLTMEQVLSDAIERRWASLVVFDDDVHAHTDALARIAESREHLPDDWLLWYLGATQKDWDAAAPPDNELYDTGGKADGSFAVALRAAALDELLEATRRFDWPFDAGPLRQLCSAYPDRCVASYPPVFIPDVSDSIIRHRRDLESFAERARWDLSLYRDRVVPQERTTVIVSVGPDHEDVAPMLATLDGLRRQDHAGQDTHVLVPAASPAVAALEAAIDRDTRVTGWTCDTATVDAAASNALKDLLRPDHLLLLTAGDVLPRAGLRALHATLSRAPGDAPVARMPAVVAPAPAAADVVDDPTLPAWGPRTDAGPTLFSPAAVRSLGDLEEAGAAGAAVWLERMDHRGDPITAVRGGTDAPGHPALRPRATLAAMAQAAAATEPLPAAARARPRWGMPRAPLTRLAQRAPHG